MSEVIAPPDPQYWQPLRLEVKAQPDGTYAGTMWLGTFAYHVQGWKKEGPQVTAEFQAYADRWFEEYTTKLQKKKMGG